MATVSKTLGSYIDDVIKETLGHVKQGLHQAALEEKEKQGGSDDSKGDDIDLDLFVDDEDDSEEDGEQKKKKIDPDKSSKTMKDDVEAMRGVPEVEDVIEKLNVIRSGQSLRDEEIRNSFDQYFNSLSDAEKVAMFVFLKGISQLITGEFTGEQAADPADNPANIQMQKSDKGQPEKKTIKPNVIKKASPPEGKKSSRSGEEDTAPPIRVSK